MISKGLIDSGLLRWPHLAVSVMQRSGVRPSVRPSVCPVFLTLTGRAAHTQLNLTHQRQQATRSAYISVRVFRERHTCSYMYGGNSDEMRLC